MKKYKVPVQILIDHIKTAIDVDPWAKEMSEELLKEQEPMEPHYNARTNWYECGSCHYSMTSGMHCRNELIPAYKVGFCARCGKAVKWNG
jgi:ribosomal protein S27AE